MIVVLSTWCVLQKATISFSKLGGKQPLASKSRALPEIGIDQLILHSLNSSMKINLFFFSSYMHFKSSTKFSHTYFRKILKGCTHPKNFYVMHIFSCNAYINHSNYNGLLFKKRISQNILQFVDF